jgi:hypothetical protein
VRIERPLLKLPIRFCANTLAEEVRALPSTAWVPHPQKLDGNIAVQLVSPGGALSDDWVGEMSPTKNLQQCRYIMRVMEELGSTWGRSRLMGLQPGADVPRHVDVHYYWRTHLRIHIPVITNPEVRFTCEGQTVHMEAGECWLLDSFYPHSVRNLGDELRIHLVLDTVGSALLWDLIDAALADTPSRFVPPGTVNSPALEFEHLNAPEVMSPWEIKCHIAYIYEWAPDDPRLASIQRVLDRFVMAWGGAWARYGTTDAGLPTYLHLLREVRTSLGNIDGPPLMMRNGWPLLDSLQRYVLANAISSHKIQRIRAAAAESLSSRATA